MPIQQPEPNALPSGSAPLPAIARNVALGPLDPYAQGADEQPADWGRYIAAVRRYRWWVAVAALLGIAGGYGAARILRPRFQAQATIWIESSARPGAADRGPIRPDQLLEAAGWVDLLKSYVVLDQVVRDLKLYVEPEHAEDSTALSTFSIAEQFRPGHYTLDVDATRHFTLLAEGGAVVQRGVAGDSIGSSIGFRWAPPATSLIPDHKLQFRLVTPRDASQKLADDIEVRIDENGNFLRMMLTGTDPVRIAAILNGVSNREVAVAADLKRAKLTELTKILESQLTSAERNLHNSENSLEGFRIRTITLPSDKTTPLTPGLQITRDPVFSSFFDMKIQREQLRRDRDAIQRVLGSVGDSGLSIEALEVIPAVVQSSELKQTLTELTNKRADLRALRTKYTDANPQVQRAQAVVDSLERQTIPGMARSLVAEISQREQTLAGQVSGASADLQAIPARSIEEARLSREVTIAENLYTTLQGRYEEARLAEVSAVPDVRVLDAAVAPQRPIKNTAPRLLLVGLVAGLGLGLLGAVLLDRLDPRVRYPDQVTRELGLPILGTLPRVNGKNGKNSEETAHVLESLRSIRLSLSHAYGAAGPLLVTITSPGPGDGKSFLSSNLAISFADAGYRTLLIDGDLRRGGLHRLLNVSRKPGLTDFLSGSADRDAVLQGTAYSALSFIGGGTRKPTAPELLGSPQMMQLVGSLRSTFNVILIDSPPLGAAVDPFLLSTVTGNLLLVLRTGATDRQLAKAKLEMLDRLPVRILGAVLNDVKPEGAYRYYGYLAGYDMEAEAEAMSSSRRLPGAAK